MVAELAEWVGPTSTEAPQDASDAPQDTSEGVEAPHTPSATPQRLPVSRQQAFYGQDDPGRSLGVGHAQAGVPQAGERPQTPPQGTPQGTPQGATLTQEEVGLLAQYQVTYQNGRWVHTELTPTGYISRFVNPRTELDRITGERDGAKVMTAVGGQMINTHTPRLSYQKTV